MKNKVWSETSLPISFSACTFQKNVSHVTFYDGAKFFFCLPHCVKSGQIRSVFWSVFSLNAGKCGPEITPYLDTFHAVVVFFRCNYLFTSLLSLCDELTYQAVFLHDEKVRTKVEIS